MLSPTTWWVEPARRRRILTLALPIIGGMVSQNIFNLVDSAMVGRLSDAALAGVGIGGFLNFLTAAFITGLATGVQAIASRRIGEGRADDAVAALNGGIVIVLLLAIPWSVFLFYHIDTIFAWVSTDAQTIGEGVPYIRARLVAMTSLGVNFAFRSYWNAIDRPGLYMRTLMVMHLSNVVLNYLLIFGKLGLPPMGAEGAGIASAIASYIGTAVYFSLAFKFAAKDFLRRLPGLAAMRAMLRLSFPSAIQNVLFAGGLTAFMAIIDRIGQAEVAASKVLVDLLLVGVLPGVGFGLAAATLVGQALGRKSTEEAARWGWDVGKIATLWVGAIGIVGIVAPDLLLSIFLRNAETRALAIVPLQIIGFSLIIDGLGLVLMNAHAGAGATKTAMVVSVGMQWLIFLPAAIFVGPVLGLGLSAVWAANAGYRILQTFVLVFLWHRRRWARAKV